MPLDNGALVKILTEPKNALIKQYQHLFSLEGAQLEFTDDSLTAFADRAMKRQTGARALRAVLEEMMLNLMYDLPDTDSAGVTYIVDRDAVESSCSLSQLATKQQKNESACGEILT